MVEYYSMLARFVILFAIVGVVFFLWVVFLLAMDFVKWLKSRK